MVDPLVAAFSSGSSDKLGVVTENMKRANIFATLPLFMRHIWMAVMSQAENDT